jgi:hypothetical protein
VQVAVSGAQLAAAFLDAAAHGARDVCRGRLHDSAMDSSTSLWQVCLVCSQGTPRLVPSALLPGENTRVQQSLWLFITKFTA